MSLLTLLCLAAPAVAAQDGAPLGPEWRNVDEVIVQAGDRVITYTDVWTEAQRVRLRGGLAITTPAQLDQLMQRSLQSLVVRALEAQAGEDQQASPELEDRIDRWLADQRRKTGIVDYVEQLEEQGLSALEEREAAGAEVHASNFRRQGLGGPRPTRDDYVRPGELREIYRSQGERLLGESPTYRLQDLVVRVDQVGSEEACRALLEELRERLIGGEPFGPIHDEYGASELKTRGVTEAFGGDNPLQHPELRRFCEAGEVGDVSPIVAVYEPRHPDRVAGYRLVRIYEKDAGAPPPPFREPKAQETLRTTIEERRDEAWLNAARARLQDKAYLWSRDAGAAPGAGGKAAAEPSSAGATPVEPPPSPAGEATSTPDAGG